MGSTPDELIRAFVRLAQGDFTVRLPRSYQRDEADTLAYFVNLIAEELDRILKERERSHRELEDSITELSELFLALAAGNFDVRAPRTGKGDPIDVLAFLFNNTAAEVGEAFGELEKQRRVLEAILESMLDGVLLLDPAGLVRRCNLAMARVLGYDAAELVDRPVGMLLADGEQEFAASLARLVGTAPFRSRDTRFRSASGEILSMAVNGSPHRDVSGALMGIVLVARDDRELKKAQAQLQLTDRLAAMGRVAAGVAHEINNPLSFVMGNLDFLAEELDGLAAEARLDEARREELEQAIRAALQGAGRVRQIVRDLKSFARVDQEAVALVDLGKLLDTSIGMIRNELKHHAVLVKDYGPVPPVRGNEARLGQVFLNLLQNAAQAIPAGNARANEIRVVSGRGPAGEALVEIHDTGCGIPPENLGRIFDAFFTTKPVGTGTGLGLSICHELVTSIGGRIEVTSELGRGTTFRVLLPPAEGQAQEETPPPPLPAPGPRRRLLVIDDEAEVGQAIRRILGRDHEVDVVTRASAALELIGERTYDVVLCDLMMPEMTGMDLHARLAHTHPELVERMAFMTGGAFSPAAREFLDRVPAPMLQKPFDATSLRSLVLRVDPGPRR